MSDDGTGDHGTYGMYQRHRKSGEEACDPCKAACRAYMKDFRRRKGNQPLAAALIAEGRLLGLTEARDAVANLPVVLVAVHDSKHLNTQGMRPCEEPDDYPHGLVQVSAMTAIDALRGAE